MFNQIRSETDATIARAGFETIRSYATRSQAVSGFNTTLLENPCVFMFN